LAIVLCSPSLSEYSIDLASNTTQNVSKQAIGKRFNDRTKNMLMEILQKIISQQIKRNFNQEVVLIFLERLELWIAQNLLCQRKWLIHFLGMVVQVEKP
jgi:hypothetical protein